MKRLIKENYYDSTNLITEYSKEEYEEINIKLQYYEFDELNLTDDEVENIKDIFPLIKNEKVGVYVFIDSFNYVLSSEQLSHRFNKTYEDVENYLIHNYNARDFDMEDSIYFINESDAKNALEWLKK